MSLRREGPVEQRLLNAISALAGDGVAGLPDESIVPGSALTRRTAVQLFEAALQSRMQDLEARRLKDQGKTFYTIGSSGHEANATFGHLLRTTDPAFLHYRSGAFMAARAQNGIGETPLFDTMLSFAASVEDPIAGGRHKVWGSASLWVPPQTSTIASHLPKAVGMAYALARMQRLGVRPEVPYDSVVYCSFGDASVNHATAQAGLNAAAAATAHNQPCPVIFVCEDNGIGISVRTPARYVEEMYRLRHGLRFMQADGCDLAQSHDRALEAIDWCRRTRRPVFFQLRTVRLMGHAGSDVEANYRTESEIENNEARDPMLAFARLLVDSGALTARQLRDLYADTEDRVRRAAAEACTRPPLRTLADVMKPLAHPAPESLSAEVASEERRLAVFEGRLPEDDGRPRHMAFRIPQALKDLMAAHREVFVFGEDVAKKGGVYHATTGVHQAFRTGRVFNTILDETTILGLAMGMAQAGCLPIPEIQYLAYVHNALDQIRGEAASLKFFSNGQFTNGMVVRIAGLGYQKGFGGHFHNDNSVGALLDIPGLVIATPSRADDAVRMLRTCAAAARQNGSVCIFLEPIALYMTKDLHEKGDGAWQFSYPPPDELAPFGEPEVYEASPADQLTIVSYANGLHMSLQVQKRLRDDGIPTRVIDLRWLAPLPVDTVLEHARATGRLLVVDECRHTMGGPSPMILTALAQDPEARHVLARRLAAADTYVPLGSAANLGLVQVEDIEAAARDMVRTAEPGPPPARAAARSPRKRGKS